jgi:hypothetical protein
MIFLFLVIKNACFTIYVSGLADFQDGSGLAIADWQIYKISGLAFSGFLKKLAD